MIGRQTLCPPRSVLRISGMGLGGSLCGAPGRCRHLLLASHEIWRRGRNPAPAVRHRVSGTTTSFARPGASSHLERGHHGRGDLGTAAATGADDAS